MAEESAPQELAADKMIGKPPPTDVPATTAPAAEVVQAAPQAVRRSMPMALSIMLGILLAAVAGIFFYRLTWFILILYLSFIVATILEAPVEWLKKIHIRRSLASVIIMVGGLILLGILLYALGNAIYGQVSSLSTNLEAAPKHINDWVHHFADKHPGIGSRLKEFDINNALAGLAPSVTAVLSNAMNGVETITWLVVMFFLVLYMLLDGADHLKTIRTLLPRHARLDATRLFNDIARAHRGWALASICNVASSSILSGTGLFLLGIPGAYVLGFFAGLGELIPNIGPLICAAPALLFVLLAETDKFIYVAGMFIVVWTIQGYTITPMMMKFSVELPVLVTIIAVLVFGTLFGFLGIFVSIPLVADMVVLWHFYAARREKDTFDYDSVNACPEDRRAPMSPDNTPPSRLRKLFRRDQRTNPPETAPSGAESGLARLEKAEDRATR
ncbi:MAG: AI-2E family transporter [Phycisphaerae bacterium]